jgi:hypothetical protein
MNLNDKLNPALRTAKPGKSANVHNVVADPRDDDAQLALVTAINSRIASNQTNLEEYISRRVEMHIVWQL